VWLGESPKANRLKESCKKVMKPVGFFSSGENQRISWVLTRMRGNTKLWLMPRWNGFNLASKGVKVKKKESQGIRQVGKTCLRKHKWPIPHSKGPGRREIVYVVLKPVEPKG
jgi:hypothetical protein